MKRISKKRESEKLRADTMRQLRDMRAVLEKDHPDLMKSMRLLLEKINPLGDSEKQDEKTVVEEKLDKNELVTIDRQKNLETILKYAASKPNSDELKKELKDFLN